MRRPMLSSLTAALASAALLAAGLASTPAQATAADRAGDAAERSAGTFSWNGTWRTSLWGDAVATHRPNTVDSRVENVTFNWGGRSIQPNVPFGDAVLRVKDRAYGSWFEYVYPGGIADSTETRRGRIYVSVSNGGKALTGEYTLSPDETLRTDFTATCIAGECLGNTASLAEIENGGTTDPTDPTDPGDNSSVVPKTGKIKGAGVVKKGTVAKYKFRALGGVKATFRCKVDRQAWRKCSSPYAVKTKAMKPGRHVLKVRAVYNGKRDKTPSKKSIRIVARG